MHKNINITQLTETNTFCILPWIHFHSLPNSKILPCCMADSNDEFSTAGEKSIISMMNAEKFKQLRLNMLNNVPSTACKRCYDLENLGLWSMRRSQNAVRAEKNVDLVKKTKEDGSIKEFKLKYFDIRFSNICNMKCRSCGPEFSSQHAQEYVEKKHDKTALKKYFNMDSIVVNSNKDGKFLKKLKPYLNDVEEVYFAGGESLVTPEHFELLQYWLENNKNINLTYTTNFSVFKYKENNFIDYWKQFKNVKIYASLDASHQVAEYLRKGTTWEDIEKNVNIIKTEAPNVELCLTPTISIWNVNNFPDFIQEWIKKGYITERTDVRLNLLTHPWWANIQILPPEYKDKVGKKWLRLQKNKNISLSFRNAIGSVRHALECEKPMKLKTVNINGLKEFFEENFRTDKFRNENLFKSIPSLKEVYKWLQQK